MPTFFYPWASTQRQVNIPVLSDEPRLRGKEKGKQVSKATASSRQQEKTSKLAAAKKEGKPSPPERRTNSQTKDNYDQVEMEIDSGAEDEDGVYIRQNFLC